MTDVINSILTEMKMVLSLGDVRMAQVRRWKLELEILKESMNRKSTPSGCSCEADLKCGLLRGADAVTEEMVERACEVYWDTGNEGFSPPWDVIAAHEGNEWAKSVRRCMQAALEAALAARTGKGEPSATEKFVKDTTLKP